MQLIQYLSNLIRSILLIVKEEVSTCAPQNITGDQCLSVLTLELSFASSTQAQAHTYMQCIHTQSHMSAHA